MWETVQIYSLSAGPTFIFSGGNSVCVRPCISEIYFLCEKISVLGNHIYILYVNTLCVELRGKLVFCRRNSQRVAATFICAA